MWKLSEKKMVEKNRIFIGLPWWLTVKNLPMQETWAWSLVQEDPTCVEQLSPRTTSIEPVL